MNKKIREEAARWFSRMQGAEPDDSGRGCFETWLASHPAHAAEYQAFAALWERLDSPSRCDAIAEELQRHRQSRRRLLKGGALGALAFMIAGNAAYCRWRHESRWQLVRQTGVGEVVRETLQDGSQLILDARSSVQFEFSLAERRVALLQGGAIFDVTRDAERPFLIDAGAARVTVLGTRFAVNRMADKIRVSVERGLVEVEAGTLWSRQRLLLAAGQVAELALDGERPGELHRVQRDATDGFGFERGIIFLDMACLSEVAHTFSRYRKSPVRVVPGRPGADPRITAAVQTRDVDKFLGLLPGMADVAVTREENGIVTLKAR